MRISLLITGQVRDEARFRLIAQSALAARDRFEKVVFSSWSDQVSIAEATFASLGAKERIIYCNSGQALPVEPTINRDIKSFLAQHHQISLGLEHLGEDSYVIRVRADSPVDYLEYFLDLHDIVEDFWSRPKFSRRSLLVAASFNVPFFFDDRTLMLTPSAIASVKSMPLSGLYRYDHNNLFPEYLIYSHILAENNVRGVFFEHDHRHRFHHSDCRFSAYDFAAFGAAYASYVIDYLQRFQSKFAFLRQFANETNRVELFDRLFPNVPADSFDFLTFYRRWSSHVDDYISQFDTWNHENRDDAAVGSIELAKQTLNFMLSEYVQRRYDNVIRLAQSISGSFFQNHFVELAGCSTFLLGDHTRAREILMGNFEAGHRGFEQLYYLSSILADMNNKHDLDIVAREFLSHHAENPRARQHITQIYSARGIELTFG